MLCLFILCLAVVLPGSDRVQAQQDDRGYLQALLEDNLSGAGREVRITGFAGALSAQATLEELTIADADGVWLTLKDVELDWTRSALLRGRLDIAKLSAAELLMPRAPVADGPAPAPEGGGIALPELPAPEASVFALPDLPVSIDIASISIKKAVFGASLIGTSAEVSLAGSAELGSGAGKAALKIERTDKATGRMNLAASYSNESRVLDLTLNLAEGPNGIAATLIGLPGRPSVDLRIAGAAPISAYAAEIRLDTDGVRRIDGNVALTIPSPSEDTRVTQAFSVNIGGDIRPLVLPQYRDFLGPDIRLEVSGSRPPEGGLNLDRLNLTSAALTLGGQVALGTDSWPLRFNLTGRIASKDGNSVLLSLPGPQTRVQSAVFTAQYDTAKGNDWSVLSTVQGFQRDAIALTQASLVGSGQLVQGNGSVIGQVNGIVEMALAGLRLPDADLAQAVGPELAGTIRFDLREDEPLRLSQISLTGSDFAVNGALAIHGLTNEEKLTVSGDIGLAASDLSRYASLSGQALGGAAELGISGNVVVLDRAFDLKITGTTRDLGVGIARLDPVIAGSGKLDLAVRRDTSGITVDRLNIVTPQSEIEANAVLTSTASTAQFQARLNDASVIDRTLVGLALLSGTFRHNGPDWQVNIDGAGPGDAIVAFAGTAQVDNGVVKTVAGTGRLAAADLSPYAGLAGRAVSGSFDFKADGQTDLTDGTIDGTVTASGRDLTSGVSELDLLLRGDSTFISRLRRDENGVFVFDRLDLKTPQVVADVTGSHGPARSRLRFNLDLRDIGLFTPDLNGPVAAMGVAASSGGDWTIDSRLTGPGGTNADVAGQISEDASRADLTMNGSGPLALANRFIKPNLASGSVDFQLGLKGPLAVSSLSGTVRTAGARMSLPGQRLALNEINATAQLGGGRVTSDVTANVSSGGAIRLSGPIGLTAPYPADLAVVLTSVGVAEPGVYQTMVDGQIGVRGALSGGAAISGDLSLGQVEIRVPETTAASVLALPGLVHINEPAAVRQTRARAGLIATGTSSTPSKAYPLDVTVNAPTRIFVRGRGLDAELGGSLRLRGTTTDVIPVGRFDLIRGRLDILGKRLDLTEAFANLQGDFDPYLRVVAETESGDTNIRFVIEGLVSAPTVTISSSPELPEDEVLSRLLFGRDLTQISPIQALRLAAAVNVLAGGSGLGIVKRLRENFGLDDLDVSTSETGETSVRAGKYISENVYSEIAIDSAGQSEVQLNLSISPSVSARGTLHSDGNTGLGLFFEKDY